MPHDDADTTALQSPPIAERRPVELTAHGHTRVDEWYWLRDRDDPAVQGLLRAENAYTAAQTARLEPLVDSVYGDILDKTQLTDVTYPAPRGEWAYYGRTVDGLEHTILCRRPAGSPPPSPDPAAGDPYETVVLDENELAKGRPYLSIGGAVLSSDQKLLAYLTDYSGAEIYELTLVDLANGEVLADKISGAYYGAAFDSDATWVFYTRPDSAMRPYQIWRHRLGTAQDADILVWQEDDERFFLSVGTTKDRELLVFSAHSEVTSEHRIVPATEPGREPLVVAPRRQDVTYSIEHAEGNLYILTNEDAENFQLFRAVLADLARRSWELLVPHREDVRLEDLDVVRDHVILGERGHATTAIRILPMGGGEAKLVDAPEAGTISLAENLDFEATEVRYVTTSLIEPPALHALDLETSRTTTLWRLTVPGYDPGVYRTARRWASAPDGTEVPLTLAWRVDRPEGPGACLLYGYGSYEMSSDPAWSSRRPIHPLLDRGVLFCIAHVRGGGELGRRWYLDGKLMRKANTFDDFIACARHLVEAGLTSKEVLAIQGGSAGGLLVGAALNRAPGMFGAVVAEVPFVDCLTTMLDVSLPLTVIEHEEWGDPILSEEAYRYILSYSPYDNVEPAVPRPKMLVTTGMNDPRVSYFEPLKWVQKLRASDGATLEEGSRARGGRQILMKIEMVAGHRGPSGRYQRWREHAFQMSFVLEATGSWSPSKSTAAGRR